MVVLVVDDSEADRALYRAVLESAGYTVLLADGGERIEEICRESRPDVILLDGMLPNTDGFAMCRALRKQPDFADTPILILSGLDEDEATVRAIEAGADGFVPKAGDWKPLLSAIKAIEADAARS